MLKIMRRSRFVHGRPVVEALEDRCLLSGVDFTVPTTFSRPDGLTAGPDNALWFTEFYGNKIGRITTSGQFEEFPIPTPSSLSTGITTGHDGNMWFVEEEGGNKIGRITPAGVITEFPIPTPNSLPSAITAGPDGNVWFSESLANKIGRITPTGIITEFSVPTPSSYPVGITAGPDGNIWFVENEAGKVGRVSVDGSTWAEFTPPTANPGVAFIATGADGNLWFGEDGVNQMARVTPAGIITEFAMPTPDRPPAFVTAGPDGNIWFTVPEQSSVSFITPSGVVGGLYPTPTTTLEMGSIATGPDGNIWFDEELVNKIGRLDLPKLGSISNQSINEGDALTLPLSATDTDPNAVLSYSLDANSLAAGINIDSNGVITWTPTDGPADSRTVTATVTDNGSPALSDSQSFNITVNNVAPSASLSGPIDGFQGVSEQERTLVVNATDPSPVDQAAGFTFNLNWGDGTTDALSGPSGTEASHVYAKPGNYTASLTATDKDGGVSGPASQPMIINTVEQQGTVLAVGGTDSADGFAFTPGSMPGTVRVTVNGIDQGSFATGDVQVYGGTGNDSVTINGSRAADTFDVSSSSITMNGVAISDTSGASWTVNGGAGNDQFNIDGSGLRAKLLGGAGNDSFSVTAGVVFDGKIDGGTGQNTLAVDGGKNLWKITGNNTGTLNGSVFANIENISGGSGNDTFTFGPTGVVDGNVDGGGGTNTVNYASYGNPVQVDLESMTAPGLDSFANIETFLGSNGSNTLYGPDTANTWQITGINAGKMFAPAATYTFTSFANLVGGTVADQFNFNNAKGVTGTIDGGGGDATLNYKAYQFGVYVNLAADVATGTGGVTNIMQVNGSGRGDVLVGDGTGILLAEAFGRNLIIGGTGGQTTLDSGTGQDIVIAGSTSYDSNQAALQALETYWSTNGGTFAQRVAALSSGISGGYMLNTSTVTHHTNNADTIDLGSANDWLFWRMAGTGADTLTGTPKHSTLI
jgi:virginiamycin B lyase